MMIERISNFRMVRTVTEGDHGGAVLHAVSDKSGERVAVRLQRGESATPELEQRWQRAVRVSRLLAHPAVVRLIQAGQLPDGSVYLIQEQVSGETLAARLGIRPRLPMNELLRLGRQIATVLVAAHARGIYHCALRPEALQLVPDPEAIGGERVKITDWGYARVPPGPATSVASADAAASTPSVAPAPSLGAPAPAAARPLSAPAVSPSTVQASPPAAPAASPAGAGPRPSAISPSAAAASLPTDPDPTLLIVDAYPVPAPPVPLDEPTYLSPEQCRAGAAADSHAPADPTAVTDRVDVYALGVLLFQMAAGQTPFSGRAPSEIIALQIGALPPKLDQRGVHAPSGLATLVAAMLIKDSTARPNIREVEERLQALAQQQQLAQTMTPAMRLPPLDPAQSLPRPLVRPQARTPAEPRAPRPARKSLWVLTLVLGVAALYGLWRALGISLEPAPLTGEAAPELSVAAPVARVEELAAANVVPPVPPSAPAAAADASPPDAPAPVVSTLTPSAPIAPPAPARAASVAPTPLPPGPALPTNAAPRLGIPPLRDLSMSSLKAPPPPPLAKPAPSKPVRPPQAVSEVRGKLLAAQTAYALGDYAAAINGATAILKQEPEAASLILGQAACALDDLTLVNRATANLRQRPPALSALSTECKKYGIALGMSGQFVRTRLR